MRECEKCRDARAHGIAEHVDPGDAEMIEQPHGIFRHFRRAVTIWLVELVAFSMPAIIVGDHASPGLREGPHPLRVDSIGRNVGCEAVDQ